MSKSQRTKGLEGEREVAAIFAAAGCSVEQLQRNKGQQLDLLIDRKLDVDVKFHERLQLWLWLGETAANSKNGSPHIVAFRRTHGPWYQSGPLAEYVELWSARR